MNVFDASAVLAYLNGEPGGDRVGDLIEAEGGVISAANYAEVMSRVFERGTTEADAVVLWRNLGIEVLPIDEPTAYAAARMRPGTRSLGLSLADRCCLALAASLDGAVVVTADRAWKALKGYSFSFIR